MIENKPHSFQNDLKVTVIVPVYNVEPYIRECLDSIINQTLRNIQIICVDDGSPDHCPEILDEYAVKDDRIMVIHQKNAGQSVARNTAYPHIKGEYVLFVDSDDSIERTLCEKVSTVADREQADMTCFYFDRETPIQKFVRKHPFSKIDRATLVCDLAMCSKLYRSKFLMNNDIRCPEGLYCEDNFVQWKALVHHPKLALLPEVMYYHRINPASTMRGTEQKGIWSVPKICVLIKEMLVQTGNYHGEWKDLFLRYKLGILRASFTHIPSHRQLEYLRIIKESIGTDELEYLTSGNHLKRQVRVFYRALLGSRLAALENSVVIAMRRANAVITHWRHRLKRAA